MNRKLRDLNYFRSRIAQALEVTYTSSALLSKRIADYAEKKRMRTAFAAALRSFLYKDILLLLLLIWIARDLLDMRESNRPGCPQKDYNKIEIINTMHKG